MPEKESVFTRVAMDTGFFTQIQEESKRSSVPPFMMERKSPSKVGKKDIDVMTSDQKREYLKKVGMAKALEAYRK